MIAPVLRFFIRVCIEPRLLPGVRCSVLNTVKSWPSCWMTMPGRSCVALTLLILLPEKFRFGHSGGRRAGRIRNDLRHAGALLSSSANIQYKWGHSAWSIICRTLAMSARTSICMMSHRLGHDFFNFARIARQALAEQLVAGFGDEHVVFDAHAQIFFGDIDSGLDGDYHSGLEGSAVVARIVHV